MWQKLKNGFISFFHRKRLIRYGVYFVILLLLFFFRISILRAMGNWLIEEDQLEVSDAIVVLGGSPEERSIKGAELFKKKYAPLIITTGSNISHVLQTVGLNYSESRISKTALKNHDVPDSVIYILDEGTSTLEEAVALRKFATQKKFKKIILVTSAFHTSRVHKYVNRKFEGSGVKLIVVAADPMLYEIPTWWHKEEGVLMVFNEYLKSFFYWWNY